MLHVAWNVRMNLPAVGACVEVGHSALARRGAHPGTCLLACPSPPPHIVHASPEHCKCNPFFSLTSLFRRLPCLVCPGACAELARDYKANEIERYGDTFKRKSRSVGNKFTGRYVLDSLWVVEVGDGVGMYPTHPHVMGVHPTSSHVLLPPPPIY
jgi:hypothetical protein